MLGGDELGAVLAGLGPDGDGRDRLTAVVALLANQASDTDTMVRGAFASAEPKETAKVRSAFTSALHSCLREQSVNAGSPATTRSV
jgi:23S rRNA C2498 (ribose-2'-O)-methylase RlmM